MLTAKESDARHPAPQPVVSEQDLKFVSENQSLEGFSGEVSEAVRQHRPNRAEIEAVALRFGAQKPRYVADAPTLESLKTPR